MDVTLTKLESEILRHRLEIDDVIAEVLIDSNEENPGQFPYTADDISEACESLLKFLPRIPDTVNLTPCQIDCLIDAIEGSTYLGAAEGNVSKQYEGTIYRAGNSLAKKVGMLVGRKIEYPVG